jgi:hypothetical protein
MLAAATILTRAAVETSAAMWYLHKNLAPAVKAKAVGDIDDCLKRLMMGSKSVDRDIMPEAVNVMTFVKHVDKEIEGFLHQYEGLSEYAHPNWSGPGSCILNLTRLTSGLSSAPTFAAPIARRLLSW